MHNFELHKFFISQKICISRPYCNNQGIEYFQNNYQVILYYFQVALIHIGLEMVFVMIRLTLGSVIMMGETVVNTMSTLVFVLIVNAMSMRLV